MDGSGNVTDFQGSDGARALRRQQALAADDANAKPTDLGTIWRELACGVLKVEDSFTRGERSYLLLREVPAELRSRLLDHDVAVLVRVILAGCVKVVAHEFDCGESTVVLHTKRVLSSIGLGCVLSRAPALVVQAAYAAHGPHLAARVGPLPRGSGRFLVASTPRPDAAVAALLSPGERDVLEGFLDGNSYAEIAFRRRRSVRTVANQLAAVFRKPRVSGRLELIRELAELAVRPSELRSSA